MCMEQNGWSLSGKHKERKENWVAVPQNEINQRKGPGKITGGNVWKTFLAAVFLEVGSNK